METSAIQKRLMLWATAFCLSALALGLGAANAQPTDAEPVATLCYDSWSEAADAVRRNSLVNVADLDELVRAKLDGRILTTKLCERGAAHIYKIVVQRDSGALETLTVNAKVPLL